MSGAAVWLWLQAPDLRSVSWWLPHGPLRDAAWWAVVIANLALLGYIVYRMLFGGKQWSVPMALRERGQSIQRQLREAEQAQREALARLAAIEARVGQLPADLETLRAEAEREAEEEYGRLVEASRREAETIARQGRSEIEAAAKLARKQLQGVAAALAVDLARQRIQEKLTPELDQAVVAQAVESMNLRRPN